MKTISRITFFCMLLLFAACKEFSVQTDPLSFSADGGTKSVYVESQKVTWTASSSAAWLSINPPSGNNDDVFVNVTASKNESTEARETFITFSGGSEGTYTVNVTQEGAKPVLLVNGASSTSMNFGASKGDSQTVQVTSNMNWSLSSLSLPSWLSMTPVNGGVGTTQVRISVEEDNNTPSERHQDIQITGGDISCTISVSQRSSNIAGCNVYLSNVLTLSDAGAFQIECDSKVKYYCIAIIETVAASRFTDDELTSFLLQEDRNTPEDRIFLTYIEDLDPNTSYKIYTIGIDANGKHGSIQSTPIQTKSDVSQPFVYITDVSATYDDSGDYWEWNTEKGAYCYDYYQWFLGDDYYYYPDIIVAWYFYKYINEGDFSLIPNDASWWTSRDSNIFDVITWGCTRDKELAGIVNRFSGSLSNDVSSGKPAIKDGGHVEKGMFKSCKLRSKDGFNGYAIKKK